MSGVEKTQKMEFEGYKGEVRGTRGKYALWIDGRPRMVGNVVIPFKTITSAREAFQHYCKTHPKP